MKENAYMSIKKAAVVSAGSKYAIVVLQLIYTAILSRILTPEDFGTVAVVNVFIIFFQLIADMGFGTGIIQNKDLEKDDVKNIFSFTVYIGFLLMFIFICFSFLIAFFYNDDEYISLCIVLSLALAFNSFNVVPNAVILKEKKFIDIAIRSIIVAIVSFTCTIFFALKGLGVYALVLYSVLNAVGVFVWNEAKTKIGFKFKPNIESLKKIWGYSMFQFGAQTLNYFNRNLDNLLIGKFFSKAELGYYNKSYTLMQYPINYLPGAITPVLHPILSEYQNNKQVIYQKYMQVIRLLSLIGCFCAAFCFFSSREIILIAFGDQWEASILPFKILCLSLWPQIITNTIAPIYQSIGYTKLMFKSLCITTTMIIGFIVCGIFSQSIVTVSIFVTIAYVINFFITFYILIVKGFKLKYNGFIGTFRIEMFIFIILILESLIISINIENVFISFGLKLLIMLATYVVLLLVTKQYKFFTSFIRKR